MSDTGIRDSPLSRGAKGHVGPTAMSLKGLVGYAQLALYTIGRYGMASPARRLSLTFIIRGSFTPVPNGDGYCIDTAWSKNHCLSAFMGSGSCWSACFVQRVRSAVCRATAAGPYESARALRGQI